MKKTVQSAVFRAIISIVAGALLVKYREETVSWITISIGVLFLLSGIISLAFNLSERYRMYKEIPSETGEAEALYRKPNFPFAGIGSLVAGAVLALMPETFITGIMYALAAILILGAINQLVNLATIARNVRIGLFYWIVPCIILLVGLLAIVKPTAIAAAPLFIIGWGMIVFGVMEIISAIKIHAFYRHLKQQQAAENTEEQPMVIDTTTNEETIIE